MTPTRKRGGRLMLPRTEKDAPEARYAGTYKKTN